METQFPVWISVLSALGIGGWVSAGIAYWSARTSSAQFIMTLHKAFFIDSTFKEMKSIVDCDPSDEARLYLEVQAETQRFTDFLNFFELVAYLKGKGNISSEDMEALVGYYLDCLHEKRALRNYIVTRTNGFENLARVLIDRRPFQDGAGEDKTERAR